MSKANSGDKFTKIFCGVDDGHDSVKVEMAILQCQGSQVLSIQSKRLTIPSKVFHGARTTGIAGEGSVDGGIYVVNDVQFTVSDTLSGNVIDTRTVGYPTSAVNRVLVNDALLRLGLGGAEVALTSGLPLGDFYLSDAQINRSLIEAKKANLLSATAPIKQHMLDGLMPNIIEHKVLPEGVGAVYDMAVKDDGSDDEGFYQSLDDGPVGVIDIGGKTIDMAVVTMGGNGPIVDMERSGSIDFGMLKVMDAINAQLRMDYQLVSPLTPRAMLRVLKERVMMFSGQRTDVTDQYNKAVESCWIEMQGLIKSRWNVAHDLSRIVVAGGGAYTFGDKVASIYPQAVTSENPEYANARGMLKIHMLGFMQSLENAAVID